jgi:glycerol-3-phosphate acyltransferase PlsX
MRTRLSPDQHAGAPLLGLNGNILKSHGSSNYIAIGNALRIARELVMHDMIDSIKSEINQANAMIRTNDEENAH